MILALLLTALVFFLLGRLTKFPNNKKDDPELTIDEIVDKAKILPTKPRSTLRPGPIMLKTPEDFESELNGEKALDDHWKKSGIAKIINRK